MKKLLKVAAIVAAVVAVVVVAALLIGPDKRRLDDEVRAASGSQFVQLSEGQTEYEIAGPETGTPVVLVHGLSVPMFDWDRQFSELADAGFRVVRYNQYGRGLSDRPRGAYDLERYVEQLNDLVDGVGLGRVHLVAHSMGGAVAAGFAAWYPEKVDRTVLIAPALHMADGNTGITLVRIPVLGDFAAKVIVPSSFASRAESLFANAGVPEADAYAVAFGEQMRYRGFTRSVKALFRGDVVDDLSAVYEQLDSNRILLIRGTKDESIPAEHFAKLARILPGMERVEMAGVGHMPNMQVADQVNELIVAFLGR